MNGGVSHTKGVRNVDRRAKLSDGSMPEWQSMLIAGFRKGSRAPFNPLLNRHTGQPHQHSREIARRLRQAK